MRARQILLVTFLIALAPLVAQQSVPFPGAIEVEQSLHKLNSLGTVLMIAAHPDDEQTAVLAYFARGRYMRTAYLSLTRGEGGQNLIGSEQGPALGVIRTQELLAARKIDGAEQFFTRAIDFGFTKTASETMEKWGHDRILSDVVWVIRRYRPDVIILDFSGTPADGHGQHQVSAILGKEAFEAAGDPNRFPEQLKFVQPWHAKRIGAGEFRRTRRGGLAAWIHTPAISRAAQRRRGRHRRVQSGPGIFVPGTGHHEPQHAPQPGHRRRPASRTGRNRFRIGRRRVLFERPVRGRRHHLEPAARRSGGKRDSRRKRSARSISQHPEKSLPGLAKARPLIAAMDDPLAKVKLQELDDAIALCAGLFVEAAAGQPEVSPGTNLKVTTTVLNRSNTPVTLESGSVEGLWNEPLDVKQATLGYNQSAAIPFERGVPSAQPYSQPYWLAKPPDGDVYQVDDQMLIGMADTPAVVRMRLKLTVEGALIEVVRPVEYRYAPRAEGERVRLLAIVPPVAVNLPDTVAVFPSVAPHKVTVAVHANGTNAAGDLRLDLPAGWQSTPKSLPFKLAAAGEEDQLSFEVTPPATEGTPVLKAVASVNGHDIGNGMQVIDYPHFPPQTLFPPSNVKLVRANIEVKAHKIGYIMGAGDQMPEALRQLGLDVTLLGRSDLEQGDLSRFDAIVAGVRAYNVRADLKANQGRLMNYVKNGGTYIVQYQNAEPGLNMGPYPFTIPGTNRYRITVEDAPVTLPHPDSPLLQDPNRITPKDFDGWIQERALYVATEWDKQYQTVLASQDPGEDPMGGGELWTRYGKGVYIFTAYSWFRQLPAGVPGAFRLFANLLSAK